MSSTPLTDRWFLDKGFIVCGGIAEMPFPRHDKLQFPPWLQVKLAEDGTLEWWLSVVPLPPGCHPQTTEAADALLRVLTPCGVKTP